MYVQVLTVNASKRKYTRVNTGIHQYVQAHRYTQRTHVYTNIQMYTEIYAGIHTYADVYSYTQVYTGIKRIHAYLNV